MQFTEDHELLRKAVRDVVEREINPHVDEWEEAGTFPARTLFKALGDAGLLGVTKPEEYGGMGLDWSYAMVVAEELGTCHCGAVPMAIGVHTDMATPALTRFGSHELKQEILVPTIAGDMVACLGVSETGAGSDVASLHTTARKDGGDYVINGHKMWITTGTQADWMCCLVNTSDGPPHENKSILVVPLDSPGIERSAAMHKLGMHSSDTAQVFFEDVRVPCRYLVGEEGKGFRYQMMQFQEERLWAAANIIKQLDRAIDQTIDYTGQRIAFGRPILHNQSVHFRLAELRTEIEALRALTYRATELYVMGEDVTRLASMAKLKAGRLARQVADSCLQFFGGMGYMWETAISRLFRDVRLLSIGGGADEVMLSIISKLEGTSRVDR